MKEHLKNYFTIQPARAELRKRISHYYLHYSTDAGQTIRFTYYPHINHAVTAYHGSSADIANQAAVISPCSKEFTSLFSRISAKPYQVTILGSFKKIGIVFKPYGLNYFISQPMGEVSTAIVSPFSEWDPEFEQVCSEIWKCDIPEQQRDHLDAFLLSRMTFQSISADFQEILNDIANSETRQSVASLSLKFNINRKTLYRLFVTHLGYPPSTFLQVMRFRKSLEEYLNSGGGSLTRAAVAQFYDQSDFIKTVRSKTQETPKKLISSLVTLKNGTYWKL